MGKAKLAAALAGLLMAACQTTVDGSSEEAFKKSISKMKEGLSDDQREKLSASLVTILMKDMTLEAVMSGAQDADSVKEDVRHSLDGKSRDEIVAWATDIEKRKEQRHKEREAERLKDEIEDAKKAVEELQALKVQAESAKEALRAFEVDGAKFYKKKQRFGRDQPVIELSVKNGTGKAVARAYFHGVVKSPGREVPWHEDDFNYQIAGGLETGETARWAREPNMFSDWGRAEVAPDAIFHVEVVRLDGADGKALFDTTEWGPRQEDRLAKLVAFLADPKSGQ